MNEVTILKNTILSQQRELEGLKSKPYHPRSKDNFAKSLIENSMIKAIIGPRRAGKSFFAVNLIRGLNFLYLNFDEQALAIVKNHQYLDQALDDLQITPAYGLYLDEIQNLEGWELWLNSLQRRGYNIIATGSNANLLSKELASHLTGRHIEIEILPFSYQEYGGDFSSFYESSGFPDILFNKQDSKIYIDGLVNSIILKDIVRRYKLRSFQQIISIYQILSANAASLFSYKSIATALNIKSEVTVRKYLNLLQEAYLCYELVHFTEKTKEFYRSPKKSYLVDIGMLNMDNSLSNNYSKKLENFVFTELIKAGFKPNISLYRYISKSGLEVDFILKDGIHIRTAIQVAFDISSLETRDRAIKALLAVHKEHKPQNLFIITQNYSEKIKFKGLSINVVSVEQFLNKELVKL
jgi:predicted AAA+ superfamily ATPase